MRGYIAIAFVLGNVTGLIVAALVVRHGDWVADWRASVVLEGKARLSLLTSW
jgi:hypothetical protein